MVGTAELTELPRVDCLRLLAAGVVGRVVFNDMAIPAAHPVVYLLDGEEIVFRTRGGDKLMAATVHQVVAFQIDEVDMKARTGWSVLGVGQAYEVTDRRRLAGLARRIPCSPWLPDRDRHIIAIPLQRLTGRRLVPSPAPSVRAGTPAVRSRPACP